MRHGTGRRSASLALLALFLGGLLLACRGAAGPPLNIGPDGLPEGQVGQTYSVTITITQNQGAVDRVWVAEGFLPAGLILLHKPGAAKAELAGTPEEAAESTIRIAASASTPSKQVGQQDFRLVIR